MRIGDVISNTAVYVTGAGFVGLSGFYFRSRHSAAAHLVELANDVRETKHALVGAPPTQQVPHPGPGIIQRLDEYNAAMKKRTDMGDTLIAAFSAQEKVVSEIKTTLSTVTVATTENGKAIKDISTSMVKNSAAINDLQHQMATAALNADIVARAAAKTAATIEAATKRTEEQSEPTVGDTASRTEDNLNDLVARLEDSEVIEKQ